MSTTNQYCTSIDKTAANKLAMYCSSNNTSWDIAAGTGAALGTKSDWGINTDYYIRHYFTGTQYKLDWSTDYNPLTGEGTWTNDITVNSTLALTPTVALTFGMYGFINGQPLIGTMDEIQVTIGQPVCQLKNQITQGKTFPTNPINGDYHCLTATGLRTYKRVAGAWVETQYVPLGTATVASGVISVVNTQGYNRNGYDTNEASFPSNKYIDLTLGASGSTYTAPADGWLVLQMGYVADKYIDLWNVTNKTGSIVSSASSGSSLRTTIPCKKGDVIIVYYSATTKEDFRFIYAEGSKI